MNMKQYSVKRGVAIASILAMALFSGCKADPERLDCNHIKDRVACPVNVKQLQEAELCVQDNRWIVFTGTDPELRSIVSLKDRQITPTGVEMTLVKFPNHHYWTLFLEDSATHKRGQREAENCK